MAGNNPNVSLKISSGDTITNAETWYHITTIPFTFQYKCEVINM